MNYTILIVDDDMAINDMLVKYLRKNGYITYSAYSGTEALLFLEKQKVNLIILDLMLPGLSGEQVLAEIKKTKNVPVIGLSAKEDSKSKIFLLKNGADDYVTKPFDIEELLARIETILRRIYENQYTSNSLLCCGDLNLDTTGIISIYSQIIENKIELIIEDNGIGFEAAKKQALMKMGVKILGTSAEDPLPTPASRKPRSSPSCWARRPPPKRAWNCC